MGVAHTFQLFSRNQGLAFVSVLYLLKLCWPVNYNFLISLLLTSHLYVLMIHYWRRVGVTAIKF